MRDRSAFGYMEPHPAIPDFAQCGTCRLWLKPHANCFWYAEKDKVTAADSCIMYVQGPPCTDPTVTCVDQLTPEETGFHKGAVRCENCDAYLKEINSCNLYVKLNRAFPQLFKLKTNVKPKACCNAWD